MRTMVSNLRKRIDNLSDSYRVGAGYLGVIRILFALHVLIFPVDYTWVSEAPPSFYHSTPGIASLFAELPDPGFLVTLQVVQYVFAFCLLLGYRTGISSVSLTLVMMTGSSIVHSFSKIDHFILFEIFPVAMAAAGWGAALSVDAKYRKEAKETNGFPLLLWASTIAFALFTAGFPKVVSGWLDPARQASRTFVAHDLMDPVKIGPLAQHVFSIDNVFLWKFIDYSTVFVESWLIIALLVQIGRAHV